MSPWTWHISAACLFFFLNDGHEPVSSTDHNYVSCLQSQVEAYSITINKGGGWEEPHWPSQSWPPEHLQWGSTIEVVVQEEQSEEKEFNWERGSWVGGSNAEGKNKIYKCGKIKELSRPMYLDELKVGHWLIFLRGYTYGINLWMYGHTSMSL